MKKTIQKLQKTVMPSLVIIAALMTTSNLASAHCRNPIEKWVLKNESRRFLGTCELSQPLKLASKTHYYPQMAGVSLQVNYWAGAFKRDMSIKREFSLSTYNCFGDLQNTETIERTENHPVYFEIENPNLASDVSQSYIAHAPLTDDEAKIEFQLTREKCLKSEP